MQLLYNTRFTLKLTLQNKFLVKIIHYRGGVVVSMASLVVASTSDGVLVSTSGVLVSSTLSVVVVVVVVDFVVLVDAEASS